MFAGGRRTQQVQARDLFCYWAVAELGISRTELARHLSMSQPAVGYAVSRGHRLAEKHRYRLQD